MQKFTLKNKINVFSFLYLLLFLCLALTCISFCHYYIYGDSQFYIADLCKLRGDYFPANFKALFSGSGDHIALKTEGGFSFFLLLFSYISWELPFFVSAFFTVGFLFILSVISRVDKRVTFPLTGILTILILFLIPKFSYGILMLSQCLRDSSAHFFGLLGFLLCCLGINKLGKTTLFLGTFCIGIACWCRVPNILFVIPAGVYLLLSSKELWAKKFFQSILLMIAGLIVGLLPLFGQNILEGRPFYTASQMKDLVLKQPSQNLEVDIVQKNVSVEQSQITKLVAKNLSQKGFSAVRKGMSLKNFSSTSKRLYQYIQGMLVNRFILWLFLVASVIAVFINYRLSLSLLSGSLCFFLFYSCYDKVVGRYAMIIPLLLLPMVALSVAKLIDFVVTVSKQQKRELLIRRILAVVMICVCLFLMISSTKRLGSLLQERKYCLEYKDNIEKVIHINDVYICSNSIINSWTVYFTGAENFRWLLSVADHWDIYADTQAQFRKFDDKIQAGKDAFYIEMQADDIPFKYWSKQDVNLHYEVNRVDEIAPMFNEYGKVIVSQITERNANERIIEYSMESENPTKLLLWTADASGVVLEKQQVVLSYGNLSVTNQLSTGINLYDIPNDVLNKNSELKILSSQKLPIIIDAIAFSTNATIVFQDYENMPATLKTLSGTKPFWYGKYHWGRESRKHGKYINPLIALPQLSRFSVFNKGDMKMTLRVSTIGVIRSQALKENLSKLTLTRGENDCPLSIDVVSWSKRGARRILVADLSSDKFTSLNDVFEFEINIKDADKASIFLESISFSY